MRILDEYTDLINASFSQWIKVEDNQSKWTIEDFPHSTVVDENITYPHCWKCVTVNHCWFKNEENKKTEPIRLFKHFIFSNTIEQTRIISSALPLQRISNKQSKMVVQS